MNTLRMPIAPRLPLRVLLVMISSQCLFAQSAQEIITRSEDLLRGKSSEGTFEMTVVTPDFTRTMTMKSWWVEKTQSQKDKSLIVIRSPKKEEGNKWLKIGNEMWNYLRATETTIKIPPSMMLQSWNGSDFTNDDLARESSLSKDYTPSLIGEEKIGDEPCWKLSLVPKPEAAVVWGKLYAWVRKKDILPAIIQYFDEKGTLVRYMVYSDVKTMGGRTIPTTWTMYNKLKVGNHTEFKILDIAFDISIPDRIFSFRELERGS
jgi:outer membrane lipoprotein-sorting protein